ncbi:MAG: ABC transporter permease, partial [Clostridiales bacterium]|nr:ABC transporter permease [Clostridiales bacterium]
SHLNSEKKSEDLPSNVKGKIVGIMDYLCYEGYYDNSQGLPDEYLTMSTILPMFKPCTLLAEYPTNKDHLVFSNKDIEIREDIQMVKLDEDISDENRKDFFLELTSKKYQAFETKEQYQHTYQREKKELQNNIVLIGISSLTAIICLVGITTLSVSKEIKTYSIYCLCGMTRKQCIGINAVYTFFLILIPSIIALIVRFLYSLFKWYQATSLFQEYYTDRLTDRYVSFSHYFSFKTSEIIAIGILFIVSLISAMIIPYFTLKKLQLTESLKNKN